MDFSRTLLSNQKKSFKQHVKCLFYSRSQIILICLWIFNFHPRPELKSPCMLTDPKKEFNFYQCHFHPGWLISRSVGFCAEVAQTTEHMMDNCLFWEVDWQGSGHVLPVKVIFAQNGSSKLHSKTLSDHSGALTWTLIGLRSPCHPASRYNSAI